MSWGLGHGFFYPLVGLITRVIWKAEKEKAEGLLIALDWPGSSYCVLLENKLREGRMIQLERFKPVMICPREVHTNTFQGRTKFYMMAVEFNF